MEFGRKSVIVIFALLTVPVTGAIADDFDFPSTASTQPDHDYLQILKYQNEYSFMFKFGNVYCDGPVRRSIDSSWSAVYPRSVHCKCDKNCNLFGDCCPDSTGKIRDREADDITDHICVSNSPDVEVNLYYQYGIVLILSCPDASESLNVATVPQTSPGRKPNPQGKSSPQGNPNPQGKQELELYPVTSSKTNISYYNEHIAKCHGESSYVPWDEDVDCSSGYDSGSQIDEDTDGDDDNENCQYIFHSKSTTSPRLCDPLLYRESVNICNVTGSWSVYDADFVFNCQGPYYPVEFDGVVYRNIFCFLCNGFTPHVIPQAAILSSLPMKAPRITIITRFKQWPIHPFNKLASDCDLDYWWDQSKEICRKLYCPSGRTLKNKECLPVNGNAFGDIYSFDITLRPRDERTSAALEEWVFVTEIIISNFQNKMAELHSTNYVFTLATGSNSRLRLSCKLLITEHTDRIELEERLLNLLFGEWKIYFQDEQYLFSSSNEPNDDVTFTQKATFWSDPVSGMCCNSVSDTFELIPLNTTFLPGTIHITEHLACPYIKLDPVDFDNNTNGWIDLVYANVSLPKQYVSFLSTGEVSVCIDTLIAAYNGSGIKAISMEVDNVQSMLSFVCVIISLLCLVCTFVTYCAFPSLRTLPAKNNMFLITYLFLAQFLFQFGVGQTEHELVCVIIGIVIHYLWLNVVLWMNVCSFHMFRVFFLCPVSPTNSPVQSKHIVRYICYTHVVSLVIVGLTIGVSMILSQGEHLGYGGNACYLSSPARVGLAFVLPLSIVLCSNLVFFAITVYSISKVEHIHRQTGKEGHNIYVYIKLSTLTGMFWTVSILSENLDLEALSYVAIVLNGSQGLLLFVCYALNRRVMLMWKGVCSQIAQKHSANGTSNTTQSTSV